LTDTEPIILVADDEPATLKYLALNLGARGYKVVTASNGVEAMMAFRRQAVDLAMLDINMPKMDGFEVCRQIRMQSSIPVIMLTARARETDVVEAFDCGADDYVTKPFGVKELLARVRSSIRRATGKTGPDSEPVSYGDLLLDHGARRVWHAGKEAAVTSTEYSLLSLLARNSGRVLTHRFILESVWGGEYSTEKEYVRAYIYRLRSKMNLDSEGCDHIASMPGIGYMFRSETDTLEAADQPPAEQTDPISQTGEPEPAGRS
jgi:two-component system KDP operon response regulator KdpE